MDDLEPLTPHSRLLFDKMDLEKRRLLAQLNADLFADGQGQALGKPYPHPSRLLRYYRRVTLYLSVLWRALKGDTFEREDDDYYD